MHDRNFFELLIYKTGANLRTEVSRYYLNYLWWVIEPVLLMAVFYVVFGVFMNRNTEHFTAFLLCGLTFWNWFAHSVNNASSSILQGQGIMMQVDIRKVFFPLEVVLQDCFKLIFTLSLLLVFLFFVQIPFSITWLALPILMIIQLCLVLGVAVLCAALVPFVPDLKFVIAMILQLLFFGSGVFYRIDSVVLPEHRFLMYLNPMAGLLREYRQILISGMWPNWLYLSYVLMLALGVLLFSLWLISRLDHIYPKVCQQ